MNVTTLSVHWSSRKESAESCAQRLHEYLSMLEQQCNELKWFKKGETKKQAMEEGGSINDFDLDKLTALVAKATNKKDVGNEIIEELGFRLSFWNRQPEDTSMSLSVYCGCYHPSFLNNVILDLPEKLDYYQLDDVKLKDLLLKTAKIWGADYGGIYNSRTEAFRSSPIGEPYFDKMLWVADSLSFNPQTKAESIEKTIDGTFYKK